MTRYYFDFHDPEHFLRDDTGQDLLSATAAHREAMKTLGQVANDFAQGCSDGSLSIEVRDVDGPIVRVAATIETTRLRDTGSGGEHNDYHFLRDAVRYRRLAARINDPDAAARFLMLAEECEASVANAKESQRRR